MAEGLAYQREITPFRPGFITVVADDLGYRSKDTMVGLQSVFENAGDTHRTTTPLDLYSVAFNANHQREADLIVLSTEGKKWNVDEQQCIRLGELFQTDGRSLHSIFKLVLAQTRSMELAHAFVLRTLGFSHNIFINSSLPPAGTDIWRAMQSLQFDASAYPVVNAISSVQPELLYYAYGLDANKNWVVHTPERQNSASKWQGFLTPFRR